MLRLQHAWPQPRPLETELYKRDSSRPFSVAILVETRVSKTFSHLLKESTSLALLGIPWTSARSWFPGKGTLSLTRRPGGERFPTWDSLQKQELAGDPQAPCKEASSGSSHSAGHRQKEHRAFRARVPMESPTVMR